MAMSKIGKYQIIDQLGSGGMGVVYLAQDPMLGRNVAIKVIDEKMVAQPEMRERFYREARALGKLLHENLTIIHDVGEAEGKPFIVMEYLKGRDLRSIIDEKEPLRLDQKLDYALQICRGLERVHNEDIIHRDIKPENIKILAGGKVKIMDFGIAKSAASHLTQTGMRVGTPRYMSPEQIKGKGVDKRSDIFSFGVVFYELLTYKKPFDGDDNAVMYQIIHEEPEPFSLDHTAVNDDLQALVFQCLAKPLEKRFDSFSTIIAALELVAAAARNEQKIKALLAEVRTLTLQQRFAEAISRCDDILKLDARHVEAGTRRQECVDQERATKTRKIFSGQIIGETVSHYHIIERLGAGGMGIVYKAEDTRLKRFVALKFLPPELTRNEDAKRRFVREAQAASALDHPNICTIHGIEQTDNGQWFICMAYYPGMTLRQRIAAGKLEIAAGVALAVQIAQGLIEAHAQGIVHRDLKPANLIIAKDEVVKIVDFGLAKLAGATRLTKAGTSMGTLAYMSPEQVKAAETDHRSDIWSLGVILYELLTGKLPFEGEQDLAILYAIANQKQIPVSQINAAVPPELEQIVEKAMQKAPADRFASMRDVQQALKLIQNRLAPRQPEFAEAPSEILTLLIEKLLADAEFYMKREKFEPAVELYQRVLALDSNDKNAARGLQKAQKSLEKPARMPTPLPRRIPTPVQAPNPLAKKIGVGAGIAAALVVVALAGWQLLFNSEEKTPPDLSGPAAAARESMNAAKAGAQEAGAETWAVATYQVATQAEQDGNAEFAAGNYTAAKKNFEQAAGMFANAKSAAQTNMDAAADDISLGKLKEMVEATRRGMLQEKSAAEKVGSKRVADELFAAAANQESEGERYFAAGGKENLSAAQKSYLTARAGYKRAREEAERRARAAAAKAGAEAARSDMAEAKRQVAGSAEERKNNSKYLQAVNVEAAAEGQFQNEDFGAAQNSFTQAQSLYAEAAKELFDAAAERLQAAQKSNLAAANESKDRLALERQRQESARRDIEKLLAQYRACFENEDFNQLQAVLGNGFTKGDEVWSGFFKQMQSLKVELGEETYQIAGKNAEVKFSFRMDYKNEKDVKQPAVNLRETWKLAETNGKWVIVTHSSSPN